MSHSQFRRKEGVDHEVNYNCVNLPFAVSPYRSLYWDMHGLVFKTSIWLLAGSTRLQLLCTWYCWMTSIKVETARVALELFCVNLVHIWAACCKSVWQGCDNGIIPYSEMRRVGTAPMHWGSAETDPHVMTQMALIPMIRKSQEATYWVHHLRQTFGNQITGSRANPLSQQGLVLHILFRTPPKNQTRGGNRPADIYFARLWKSIWQICDLG